MRGLFEKGKTTMVTMMTMQSNDGDCYGCGG